MRRGMSRRDFLWASALATPVVGALARNAGAQASANPGGNILMGAQSFSFRQFGFEESIEQLKRLGLDQMEFCAVHFPPDAEHEGFEHVKQTIEAEGIGTPCYGVEGFTADVEANRRKFEFAKALGVQVLTANPTSDSFDNLEELCAEFNVAIAIHNHGPGARYDKVADTLNAVEGRHPLIGACVDTGHAIRSEETPHEVIEALGDRVISVHLKDWIHGGSEQILGKGDMDLDAVAKALKGIGFKGALMMEYEESPEDPVPDMKIGWDNWMEAWERA